MGKRIPDAANKAVERVYSYGKSYPDGGAPPGPGGRNPRSEYGGLDGLETRAGARINVQHNQCPDNAHGPGYSGDVQERWIKEAQRDATTRPGFDKGNAWRKDRR